MEYKLYDFIILFIVVFFLCFKTGSHSLQLFKRMPAVLLWGSSKCLLTTNHLTFHQHEAEDNRWMFMFMCAHQLYSHLSRNLQPLSKHHVGLFIYSTFRFRRLWDDLSGFSPLLDKLSLKCSVRWFQPAKSCRVIVNMIRSNRLTKSKMLQIHAME